MAISLEKEFAEANLNKSAVLAGREEVEAALSLLDGAIEDNPDISLLYLNRGLIREMRGDLKGACEDWQTASGLGAEEANEYLKECND
jgi:tetratricopeptide (TPR) repeat protein